MTSITIEDVGDYLSDSDVRELAIERGIIRTLEEGAFPGEKPETNAELWKRLADEIRSAAESGDRAHLEILLLRMLRYADIDQPRPMMTARSKPGVRYRA